MHKYSNGTTEKAYRTNPRGYYEYRGSLVKRPLFPDTVYRKLSRKQREVLRKPGNIIMLRVVDNWKGSHYEPIVIKRSEVLQRVYR